MSRRPSFYKLVSFLRQLGVLNMEVIMFEYPAHELSAFIGRHNRRQPGVKNGDKET